MKNNSKLNLVDKKNNTSQYASLVKNTRDSKYFIKLF